MPPIDREYLALVVFRASLTFCEHLILSWRDSKFRV